MTVEYTNRKDERYTLYEGRTKTGKPKFFCSRKPSKSGVPAHAMPEGYEWRESPANGNVTVRKVLKSEILPHEKESLEEGIRKEAGLTVFIVDIDGDHLVVYMSDAESAPGVSKLATFGGGKLRAKAMIEAMNKRSQHSPMLRFKLEDIDNRLFSVERWCFRGAIDDWIFIDGPAPLANHIKKYVRHLGQESFYDLI